MCKNVIKQTCAVKLGVLPEEYGNEPERFTNSSQV